jgi:nitrate reductase beta subunit
MKVESITFLSDLKDVEDIFNYNMYVAVKLDDGHEYIIVVATQKNLLTLMNNEKSDFLSPGDSMIIVKKLTKGVVKKVIEAYAEKTGYYLKLYAAPLDIKTFKSYNHNHR